MPRWTIHCAVSASGRRRDAACRVWPRTLRLPFFVCDTRVCDARGSPSRSNTMCLPARCTRTIRLPSSVAAMTPAGDLSGCGREPIQTDSTVSPAARVSRPRAIVSTSGSSGTLSGYKISVEKKLLAFTCWLLARSQRPRAKSDFQVCSSTARFGMLGRTHQVPPIFPVFQSIQQRRNQCVRPWGGLRVAQFSKWSSH
jgi:hypothetical protein